MNDTPMNIDETDAPFTGPEPVEDQTVSQRPQTDGDIDQQEYYDEGLAGAAGIDEDSSSEDAEMPEGYHIE